MSTVLLMAGTRPVHLSGLRSLPDHTTSKIFSKLWPFLVQPLMIWMRSRLPEVGSFTAQTTKVGAMPFPPSGILDRIQIIKGWTKNGQSFEKIFDVVWSGSDRKPD